MSRPMFTKRDVEKVCSVEKCPWKDGYSWVIYQQKWENNTGTALVKIYYRKDGTEYITFEGKRYNIGYITDYDETENKKRTERLLSAIFDGVEMEHPMETESKRLRGITD
jgi:hypothetical protein